MLDTVEETLIAIEGGPTLRDLIVAVSKKHGGDPDLVTRVFIQVLSDTLELYRKKFPATPMAERVGDITVEFDQERPESVDVWALRKGEPLPVGAASVRTQLPDVQLAFRPVSRRVPKRTRATKFDD